MSKIAASPNKHRRRLIAILATLGAVVLIAFAYWHWTGSGRLVPKETATSLAFEIYDQPTTTLTNSDGLKLVMEVLSSGRPVEPHACAAAGKMRIRFTDGQTLSVAYAPGHEVLRYEFGMAGHVFTVSRSRFFDSLSAAGMDVGKIPK